MKIKTFDIALKYAKNIDFKTVDIFSKDGFEVATNDIQKQAHLYLKDSDNIESNENYRSEVFEAAIFHLADKAHGRTSCFDVACAIVDSNMGVVDKSGGEWKGYPELMEQLWNKYIDEMDKKPMYIAGSETNMGIFMVAYHYTVD